MRRQRFPYTLTSQEDVLTPKEEDELSTILSSQLSLPDPLFSQIFSQQEPLVPCYLYQYPVIQIPSEAFQSVSSLIQSSSLTMNPYDNLSYFDPSLVASTEFNNSPPISDSGYGDGLLQEGYTYEEMSYDSLQTLPPDIPDSFPMVTSYGAVTILLRHLIRVDISPEKSVYVTNSPSECVAVANATGEKNCIMHPNGRIFHDGQDIHMLTLNRKAKMSKRGIVFTSSDHCLSYLVDPSGTKTTAEKFRDLAQDFSYHVFYSDTFPANAIEICYHMVQDAVHKTYKNGDEVWILGGFRIKQDQWGDVKVSRNYGRRMIRVSPTNGQVNIKSDCVEMTVGRYPNNYFLVRRGDQMVSASLKGFTVQNGTQRAGFNGTGKLVLK